jgi:UPF0716 protein FxsA
VPILIPLVVLYGAAELLLLLALADFGSWQAVALEVLLSALLGAGVLRYASTHFGRRIIAQLTSGEFPGETVADGAMVFVAGVLLILPGLIGDVVGLLLLVRPIRRWVVGRLKRRYAAHAGGFGVPFGQRGPSEDPLRDEVILEGHVIDLGSTPDEESDRRIEE